MLLLVNATGTIHCVYDEQFDLTTLGPLVIQRASHVEPTVTGLWQADLGPVGGPVLGPYRTRSQALHAEVQWLERVWMSPPSIQAAELTPVRPVPRTLPGP